MAPKIRVIEIPGLEDYGVDPYPEIGDIFEFTGSMSTRAKLPDGRPVIHPKGSIIQVVEVTKDAPYGEISETGRNLLCRDQFHTSVWSTLESGIVRGHFKLIYRRPPELRVSGPVARRIMLDQEWAVYSVLAS